ncbi:MAG TPA: hypothetical protein VFU35_04585 [Jatrophihabitans sp.]|nr:hypothetical protein [Jatrophihabitans sp.]
MSTKQRKRRTPRVTLDTEIGPDVDLEREVVTLPNGERLTNQRAEQIVAEVRGKAGRPSLGKAGTRSPVVAFRLPADLRALAERVAAREGKSVSALAREALEARLSSAGTPPRADATVTAIRQPAAAAKRARPSVGHKRAAAAATKRAVAKKSTARGTGGGKVR